MTSNHNYECFNGGCHGMAANLYFTTQLSEICELYDNLIN